MAIPKINSAHGSDTRNVINRAIEVLNQHGIRIQNLVAKGQLNPSQYAELIKVVNENIQRDEFNQLKLESDATVQAIFKKLEIEEVGRIDSTNLWQISDVTLGNLSTTSGNVVASENNYVTNFKRVDPTSSYTFYADGLNLASMFSFRLVYYDRDYNYISSEQIGPIDPNVAVTKITPSNVYYTRIAVNSGALDTFSGVKGNTPLPEIINGEINGFWDDIPRPPLFADSIDSLHVKKGAITPKKTTFFERGSGNQLLDVSKVQLGKSVDLSGVVIDESGRWLSDFIPFDSSENKISTNTGEHTIRAILYDENKKFIVRTGFAGNYQLPEDYTNTASYIRLSGTAIAHPLNNFMVNYGDKLLPYEEFTGGGGIVLKSEYLPQSSVDEKKIIDLIEEYKGDTNAYTPSFPKFNFKEVSVGWHQPVWMSADGKIIYVKIGYELLLSRDECKTFESIVSGLPGTIQGVRELSNGEIIFSTERDESKNLKSKVYKTINFNRENPNNTKYKEVLEIGATQAKVNNSWGLSNYENIVTVSEYGLRGVEGARRVWLSQDYGDTFKLIFDQMIDANKISGAPKWTDSAHMHTATYDPYWNRLWVVVGDNPNTAAYYSDDFGSTWTFINDSTEVQYTGILALPNAVLFGSDRAPNGVYVYKRGNKSDMPIIKPLLLVNDNELITHVFQSPFKKDWETDTPVFFSATDADGRGNNMCVATIDAKKAFIMHDNNPGQKFSGRCWSYLGPTSNGNIIAGFQDADISGFRIGISKAPTWSII